MKKTLILLLAFILIFPGLCTAAQYTEYINDGRMNLSGTCEEASLGDIITLSVVSSDFDWQNAESREALAGSESAIAYYDETTADANGGYKFNYILPEQGEYTLYIGSGYFGKAETKQLVYINKTENEEAIAALNSPDITKDAIEALLKDGRYSLGIYQDLYDEADLGNAAQILYDYYSAGGSKTTGYEDTKALIYKAFMVDLLSKKDISTMEDYSGCTGIENESIGKYYDGAYAAQIAESISDMDISTIGEYEDALFYAIAGNVIKNNDNVGNIKNLLLDYYEKLDIDKSDITSGLASYLAGKSLYTKESIKTAVADYKDSLKNTGGKDTGKRGSSPGASLSGYEYPQTELPKQDTSAVSVFTDLYLTPWAEEAVYALYGRGVIAGRGDRTFAPTEPVLREECAKLITEGFKFYVTGDKLTFDDVPEDSWFSKYVSRAYHSEIIKGFSEKEFGAGYPVTRQDLAVMVYNALRQADIILPQDAEIVISDADKIAPYAVEAVEALCKAGIISGDENGSFNPVNSANRAETAKILYYALNLGN